MSLPGTRNLLRFAVLAICLSAFSGNAVAQIPGPSISYVLPVYLSTGETVDITITGRNFEPGDQVTVDDQYIRITNILVVSSTEITATLALGDNSWGGTLRILSPNGITAAFTLTVLQAPVLNTSSLPGGAVGMGYSQTLTATRGAAPYTWAITSGKLPEGMTLDKNTGILSGVPLTTGTYNFSVTITDHNNLSSAGTPLTLVVASTNFGVTPTALEFTYIAGDASAPAAGSVSVFSVPAGLPVTLTASTSNGGNWLSANASTATAPANIAISVTPGSLAPGNYSGQITVAAAAGPPINIPVSFNILQSALPQLHISPTSGHFTLTSTSASAGGQLSITNAGSGSVQFTAASDQPWLTVTSATNGTATRVAPSPLVYSVNPDGLKPGAYAGHINITAQNAAAIETISLVVTTEANTMQLSRRGLEFAGTQYGIAQPAQTFMVLNNGSGTLNWTTETQGGSWLTATASGTATSGSPGAVTVTANQGNLSPGQYYGIVTVTGNSADAPQSISVVLNVERATGSGVLISPGMLTLAPAPPGNAATGQVTFFNLSHTNTNYTAFVTTSGGGKWLNTAASGTLAPGANTIAVTASAGGASFATYTGTVLFAFDDGNSAIIPVTMTYSAATTSTCSASALIVTFTQPVSSSFMAPQVAVPQTIQVQAHDNCGKPVNGSTFQVTFSNNDLPIDLHNVGSGIWEATWVPANPSSNPVQLTASAALATDGKTISGSGTMAVPSVQPAFSNGAANPAAIVDAALGTQAIGSGVAPGSYIAIYGNFLADSGSVGASASPLPQTLGSTQVFLGGQPVPVLYASPSQVNVVVPQNVTPGATLSLEVQHNATYSAPVPVSVSALNPGIYTINSSGNGPGVVQIAGTTLLAQPSGPGARPVQSGSEFLTIYANGLGPVIGANGEPAPADGQAAQPPAIYHTASTVTVTLGGVNAPVTFAGLTPGLVQLYQVNVKAPAGVQTGDAVPLVLTVTSVDGSAVATSNTVTVAVQ